MWKYDQKTGDLHHNDEFVGTGYSGHGEGRNNPKMQDVKSTGPIPRGHWRIGPPRVSENTGPITMDLDPLPGTDALGRSLFRIHGDNKKGDGSASDGCIILARGIRQDIASSGDRELQVT